jgi:superfamily II DNA helicase RecQ
VQDTQIATRGSSRPECVIFYGNEDCDLWDTEMSATRGGLNLRRGDLEQMREYCLSTRCRHLEVINHLKPDFVIPSNPRFRCLSCDVCLAEPLACPDDDNVMLDLP